MDSNIYKDQINEILHQKYMNSEEIFEDQINRSVLLASFLLQDTDFLKTDCQKKAYRKQHHIMSSNSGLPFLMELTDCMFRSQKLRVMTYHIRRIIRKYSLRHCVSFFEFILVTFYSKIPFFLAFLLTPIFKFKFQQELSSYLFNFRSRDIQKLFQRHQQRGLDTNVTVLGEHVFGQREAKRRLHEYLTLIKEENCTDLCIKLSALSPDYSSLAHDYHKNQLKDPLRCLFRASQLKVMMGRVHMIHVDMESYKELSVTIDVFKEILDEDEFLNYTASIALQAYLPESYAYLKALIDFAQNRVSRGGAPIRIRLVKGANLAMEKVEASLSGWAQAPFCTKRETDCHFKRLLKCVLKDEVLSAVKVGIGSHNIFDISYALILREIVTLKHHIEFEMLEGMGTPLNQVILTISGSMLMYSPLAQPKSFDHAIAYLVRRLDENASPEHFLYNFFDMKVDDDAWTKQKAFFEQSCEGIDDPVPTSFRCQNRLLNPYKVVSPYDHFLNEPDTDWSIDKNRKWINDIFTHENTKNEMIIPVLVGGKESLEGEGIKPRYSPNNPTIPYYKTTMASEAQIDLALKTAHKFYDSWTELAVSRRAEILLNVGLLFKENRGELIQCIVHDGGKIIMEADSEVSEAIDFIHYYVPRAMELRSIQGLKFESKGTVLVTPPWNFPCAIPVGCICAALVTGNMVLFKPAPEAEFVGWKLVNLFWRAGIPKHVLQFIPCSEDSGGIALIKDNRLNMIQLTGSTKTAQNFNVLNPKAELIAETGGKNTIIITASADRDDAISGLVRSALGHSGQKCSAASLGICFAEVYDDPLFRDQLKDAASSLICGHSVGLNTDIVPLISLPNPRLQRALFKLEEGESWLLEPQQDPHHPHLWSPGIKCGVRPGSFFHHTECFGPVLGLMRVSSLQEAVEIANATDYGLTAGLYSLDENEQDYWLNHIEVGNAYINRETTGAIIKRQPFGGCKKSSFGLGYKAGGPHYLNQLWTVSEIECPTQEKYVDLINDHIVISDMLSLLNTAEEKNIFLSGVYEYDKTWKAFCHQDDHVPLLGQRNYTIYKPHKGIVIRVQEGDRLCDILRCFSAAYLVGIKGLCIVYDPCFKGVFEGAFFLKYRDYFQCVCEDNQGFEKRLIQGGIHRVRFFKRPPETYVVAASKHHVVLDVNPVVWKGELELMHVVRELTVSHTFHRYGNCYKDANVVANSA